MNNNNKWRSLSELWIWVLVFRQLTQYNGTNLYVRFVILYTCTNICLNNCEILVSIFGQTPIYTDHNILYINTVTECYQISCIVSELAYCSPIIDKQANENCSWSIITTAVLTLIWINYHEILKACDTNGLSLITKLIFFNHSMCNMWY